MKENDAMGNDLLWRNDVFADIVNAIMFDGKNEVLPEDLENGVPLSVYNSPEGVRAMYRDVIKYWKKNKCYLALIAFENQTAIDPDMVFRDIGYLGTAYRDQLNRGSARYPVFTFVLYSGQSRWKKWRKLSDCLVISEELKPFFQDYQMNIVEIRHLSDDEINRFQSVFRNVADILAHFSDGKFNDNSSEESWDFNPGRNRLVFRHTG